MNNTRFKRRDADAGVLPLINVVFLLLIFFMAAARLAPTDPFAVAPPQSAATADAPQDAARALVAADGRLALEGVAVSPDALGAALEGRDVRLLADADAEAAMVIALLGRMRAAGARSITLVTAPLPEGLR